MFTRLSLLDPGQVPVAADGAHIDAQEELLSEDTPLTWDTELNLFGPAMIRQWTGAMIATALLMSALMGTIFAAQGEWEAVCSIVLISAGAAGTTGDGVRSPPWSSPLLSVVRSSRRTTTGTRP